MLVPDIHQDIGFLQNLRKVILKENYDHVIFLRDYFDAYFDEYEQPKIFREFCRLLNIIMQRLGDKATFLCGNYDLQYYLAWQNACKPDLDMPRTLMCWAWQFTTEKARIITEELGQNLWDHVHVVTESNRYIISTQVCILTGWGISIKGGF